jgi:hypothetical protein
LRETYEINANKELTMKTDTKKEYAQIALGGVLLALLALPVVRLANAVSQFAQHL